MALNFTGFDGNNYSIPYTIPEAVYEYNYYLLFYYSGNCHLFCFNDTITVQLQDSKFIISSSQGSSLRKFFANGISGTFNDYGAEETFSLNSSAKPIYSSENLLNYKDLILTNNFTLPVLEVEVPEVEDTVFTLSSVVNEVHEEENIVKSSFDDIFGILPVLLVVLISFIGIRKGISYLFSLLKHS